MDIIGRQREIDFFQRIMSSVQAEFVAVYGRRRVGKTFLIHEFFSTQKVYLACTGIKDGSLRDQISHFMEVFSRTFYPKLPQGASLTPPDSWREAFQHLTTEIKRIPAHKTVVVFLDELPWLASPKSKFLQNLDYFWNNEWSRLHNFRLIVCGSAASWMMNNLINAKGGLHNRITKTLLLKPFDLSETKTYLNRKKIKATDKDILDLYMVMGGIPYYLNQLDPSKSVAQNINALCFKIDGLLYNEFPRLFRSLFDSPELSIKIAKAISQKTLWNFPCRIGSQNQKIRGGAFPGASK